MSTKQRIFIPTYVSSVDYQPARVQPRILFYNGLKPCEPYFIASGSQTLGSNDAIEAFPYFDNYSGANTTTASLSLLFFNEEAPYGQTPTASLYTQYWEDYVELLYNPRTRVLNASAIIPLAEYFKMELNDIVEFRGNYYHLRAINDYNLKNGECDIQLLGPILAQAVGSGQVTPSTTTTTIAPCQYNELVVDCSGTTTSTSTTTAASTTTTTAGPCNLVIDYLIVGAGGEGWSGGGGAGQFITGSTTFTTNQNLPIVAARITTGTTPHLQVSGSNSTFLGLSAMGGGNGGSPSTAGPGGNVIIGWVGASGGGSRTIGGTGLFGFNGGNGAPEDTKAGGGGGAAAVGQPATGGQGATGGIGGIGKQWLDNVYYAGGGRGEDTFTIVSGSSPAAGGGGQWNIGPSGPGMVKIRYAGTPIATGGTITQSGGFTFHTFIGTSVNLVSEFVFDCGVPTTTTTAAPTTTTTTTTSATTTTTTSGTTTTTCSPDCRINVRVRMVNGSGSVRWTTCCGGVGRSGIIPSGASYTIRDCIVNGSQYSVGSGILDTVNNGSPC